MQILDSLPRRPKTYVLRWSVAADTAHQGPLCRSAASPSKEPTPAAVGRFQYSKVALQAVPGRKSFCLFAGALLYSILRSGICLTELQYLQLGTELCLQHLMGYLSHSNLTSR